jgi:hypothetical protein
LARYGKKWQGLPKAKPKNRKFDISGPNTKKWA